MTMPPGAMRGQLWSQNQAMPCIGRDLQRYQCPSSGATQPRAAPPRPVQCPWGCSPLKAARALARFCWQWHCCGHTALSGQAPCPAAAHKLQTGAGDPGDALLLAPGGRECHQIPAGSDTVPRSPEWARPHQQQHSCPALPCPSPALLQGWSTSECQGDQCGFRWPWARTG